MIRRILDNEGNVIATVFNMEDIVEKMKDLETIILSPDDWGLQLRILSRNKGYSVKPYVHFRKKDMDIASEILIVIEGCIRVSLYDSYGVYIGSEIIKRGMGIIMKCPHAVEYLELSKVLEVKEGPYPGKGNDKVFLHSE